MKHLLKVFIYQYFLLRKKIVSHPKNMNRIKRPKVTRRHSSLPLVKPRMPVKKF